MSSTSTLVLLRHGQSVWNAANIFTGWTDVVLSDAGEAEAKLAGTLMADEGIDCDVVHTSLLVRAISTANIALKQMGLSWIPAHRSWRLNERHYGSLQGLDKKETAEKYGSDQVHVWRRSYDTAPPALNLSDVRHPSNDRRYASVLAGDLPSSESLADVVKRMLPYWHGSIVPDLQARRTTLVVAHGNSLRALVMHLESVSTHDISDLNIPTGIPLVYTLDKGQSVMSRRYLGDADALSVATEAAATIGEGP